MAFSDERITQEGLTFDDVLLIPSYSEIHPREVTLRGRFSRNISLETPLVSAAMDTVTESSMAIALASEGGIGVIHKNMSIEAQAEEVAKVKTAGNYKVAAGIGITANAVERSEALVKAGVDALVLDCAHGHSKNVITLLKQLKGIFDNIDIVVGNIATAEAVVALADAGADGLKVGIGPGSICTTRVVAGVGVPQLSAIFDTAKAAAPYGIPIIGDGGLRYSGDVVKALAAGADCVMCGSMFAGTSEAPGEIFEENGCTFKTYRGMGSIDAMNAGSSDRYFQSESKKLVPEGIVGKLPFKGSVHDIIYQLVGGIRAGMGYCGAADLAALKKASFTRITSNGVVENHPHDITISKKAPNYSK